MKKKKPTDPASTRPVVNPNVLGLRGETTEQPITDTLEQNYMPYAMSVIVSRAIPEIDGLASSHLTESFCTPCTKWDCSPVPAPKAPTSSARP